MELSDSVWQQLIRSILGGGLERTLDANLEISISEPSYNATRCEFDLFVEIFLYDELCKSYYVTTKEYPTSILPWDKSRREDIRQSIHSRAYSQTKYELTERVLDELLRNREST